MKRVLSCLMGMLLSVFFIATAYGGGVDNKTNWSAEYIRTLNRNAATDYADIAAYNPAGTVKLHKGFTLNASAQYLDKEYANNISISPNPYMSLESDEPSVVPGLFGVYNTGKWSAFGAVTVVGGGGKVDFNQGNFRSTFVGSSLVGQPFCPFMGANCAAGPVSQRLEAESVYLGYTLGAAYNLNDIFSFSVGVRYVDAHREVDAAVTLVDAGMTPYTTTVGYEEDANGFGGIFGINISPSDKVNIGMRFETKTGLDLEAKVPAGAGAVVLGGLPTPIVNGGENSRDLPAIFAIGVSYWVTPKLRVETNLTHYFNSKADWGGIEDEIDDGYDFGIALEYHFTESFLASLGYLRTVIGVDPHPLNTTHENPELDAHTVGGGVAFAITESLHTNLAVGYVFYEDNSFGFPFLAPGDSVEYEKRVIFGALGLEYRF